MDLIDKQILLMLQENSKYPLKHMAEKVFLSSPAVSARISHMEDEGIILGYHVKVNWFKLGYQITAFISLGIEPVQKPEFYYYIRGCPNVMECSCVTGDFSMLLKVRFRSTQELDAFIGEIQRFGKTSTQIVFSTAIEHRGIQSLKDCSGIKD